MVTGHTCSVGPAGCLDSMGRVSAGGRPECVVLQEMEAEINHCSDGVRRRRTGHRTLTCRRKGLLFPLFKKQLVFVCGICFQTSESLATQDDKKYAFKY